MIVVSFGVPKSGSTLAFEMAKAILEFDGHPQVRLSDELLQADLTYNFANHWSDDNLARLVDDTRRTKIVVKTHRGPDGLSTDLVQALVASGDLRIHVVYRDPRDTVLSMLDHGVRSRARGLSAFAQLRSLDTAVERLGTRLAALRQWGSFPSVKLPYERFAFDPTWGPRQIAADLGIETDPELVWEGLRSARTKRNIAQPQRHRTDLWPDERARIEEAFPLYLELVRTGSCPGWFERP